MHPTLNIAIKAARQAGSIILRSSEEHQIRCLENKNIIFSMTRDNITLHSWNRDALNANVSHGEVSLNYRCTYESIFIKLNML